MCPDKKDEYQASDPIAGSDEDFYLQGDHSVVEEDWIKAVCLILLIAVGCLAAS